MVHPPAGELVYDMANQKLMGRKIDGCPTAGEPFSIRFYIDRAQWEAFFNDGLSFHHHARRDGGKPLESISLVARNGGSVTIDKLVVHEVESVWESQEIR